MLCLPTKLAMTGVQTHADVNPMAAPVCEYKQLVSTIHAAALGVQSSHEAQ